MTNINRIYWYIGAGSSLSIVITLFVNYIYATKLGVSKQGVFGDMFGASNALFTGLSFTGLIITILLQRQDLKDTRKEVQIQNEVRRIEKFENTLFNSIHLHNQLIEGLHASLTRSKTGLEEYSGRKVFFHSFAIINASLNENASNFENVFENYHKNFSYNIDHYFSSLKQIITFIDNFTVSTNFLQNQVEKEKYTAIVQSHMSEHEKVMIFFWYSFFKNDIFNLYIEKYGLLKGLNKNRVPANLLNRYSKSAYL